MSTAFVEIVENSTTLVCCGSGGVGKTTTAAVIAMAAARKGRNSVVVTIDPARRLAHALGLDTSDLGDDPRAIDPALWDPENKRVENGSMSAVMLNAKSTFDSLVEKYANNPAQVGRILDNTFYKNISAALSGTQEYMAMEKLYELHESGAYDLVVIDTPPSRNALDFLDAPNRMTKFLEGRAFRVLTAPARGGMRLVTRAARVFLRTTARVLGSEVLDDIVEFFGVFEGMYEGFHHRAAHVRDLLAHESTLFMLIASPRRDALEEAEFFAEQLREKNFPIAGAIVNRLHPHFTESLAQATRLRSETFTERANENEATTLLAELYANLASFQEVAQKERDHLVRLEELVSPGPVEKIPFLGEDVHDFSTLRLLEDTLFSKDTEADKIAAIPHAQ